MERGLNVDMKISLQELGYMSRRGHPFGMVSTWETTWVFKTDKRGLLLISDGIPWNTRGDDSCVSVTEVCSTAEKYIYWATHAWCQKQWLLAVLVIHCPLHCAGIRVLCFEQL